MKPNNLIGVQVIIVIVAAIAFLEPVNSLGPKQSYSTGKNRDNKHTSNLYGPGFYNHSGCLYSYIGGGEFHMTTADGFKINETLDLSSLEFESTKTKCTGEKSAGKLTYSFKLNENKKISSLTVSMKITPPDSYGYWEVSQANLTVTRADIDRKRTFSLRTPGIYAGSDYSYSCSALSMSTMPKRKVDNETKPDPLAIIILERFQLQPSVELERVVFAKSYDCSSWITIPGFMGLILISFMLVVTVIGIVLLKNIVTNDFKFNKEGLLFTQSQMETNKNR